MAEKLSIYKCNVCGQMIQVLFEGIGELVCCDTSMELILPKEDTNSELGEKHTPEIRQINDKKFVEIKQHPMEDKHFIQFIEAYKNDKSELRLKYFNPHETAEYEISDMPDNITVSGLCNIHGLWRTKND